MLWYRNDNIITRLSDALWVYPWHFANNTPNGKISILISEINKCKGLEATGNKKVSAES
jgi:hypothetical protein